MAEYQKIEYRLGKDGTIVETVLNVSGASCMEATAAIEQVLGTVESRELLPSYDESEEALAVDLTQSLQQHEQR